MKSRSTTSYSAPALAKGLQILEVMAGAEEALTMSEIAQQTGRTVNELFRMLAELEEQGYVLRDKHGAYSLSLKLFRLASLENVQQVLVRLAHGPMRDYAAASDEECHLCTLDSGMVVVLASRQSSKSVRVSVRPGSVHHPMATTSGRLMLASLPEEEQRWHLAEAKRHFPGQGLAVSKALPELRKLQGKKNLFGQDAVLEGLSDYVVLLPSVTEQLRATLATSWFSSRKSGLSRRQIEVELHRAATLIADQL